MSKLFSNLGSFFLMAMFIGGYFPINMILAFIYGDKVDFAISFFVPFYGLYVMLF